MYQESHPLIRRVLRLIALPYCYFYLTNWSQCTASKTQVIKDFLYIFFKLKYFPDNYSPCRFWEKDKKSWDYYYGSSYDPYQRSKLRKEVQRYEYLIVFDDKEVCDLLCRGIGGIKMPQYYGAISPSTNYKKNINDLFDDLDVEKIIIKPTRGSAGQGIAMASKKNGGVEINTGVSTIRLNDYQLKEKSILQEVVIQDDCIAKISSASVNTIRVVTFFTKSGESIVVSASMRFSVGNAFVDNWSAGGIAVGVDHNTGMLKKIAYDKKGNQYFEHPVSGIEFYGFQLPHWNKIIEMAIDVQKSFLFLKLLGMDLAITINGPVLIEVNPSTDLVFQEQTAGPLLKDRRTLEEFEKYDLLINKYQKNLLLKQ